MDQPQKRITICAAAGAFVLFLLILVTRHLLREAPTSTNQQPTNVESAKSLPQQTAPDFAATDNQPTETPLVSLPEESTVTNAAALYRQAFALYDALSKDEKGLLGDWRTNVDASVEAELCEKMRPICDLMHQATAVTNCDWEIEPLTFDTKLPHLGASRAISRAAIWNAAHCRGNDVFGASEDVLATLRLGQTVSHTAIIGCLVDMAIQGLSRSYVAENLGLFRGTDAERLATAFNDPANEVAPSGAIEQEASAGDRLVGKLASLPDDEFQKETSKLAKMFNVNLDLIPDMDRTTTLGLIQQIVDAEHNLAKALSSSSWEQYQASLKQSAELQEANPVAKQVLPDLAKFLDRTQSAAVQQTMLAAALAVAQEGPSVLQSHPDPSNGQPFVYSETPDGFELQSGFKTNGVPLKMQFK